MAKKTFGTSFLRVYYFYSITFILTFNITFCTSLVLLVKLYFILMYTIEILYCTSSAYCLINYTILFNTITNCTNLFY